MIFIRKKLYALCVNQIKTPENTVYMCLGKLPKFRKI